MRYNRLTAAAVLVAGALLMVGCWADGAAKAPPASGAASASRRPTSGPTSRPEEWLPLVHNSIQPPPEIGPIKLPPTSPQPGDGQAELIHRAALAWLDVAITEVDKIIPAAEAAADAIIAGGDFYITGSPGFIAECNGRAGGMAFMNVWDGKHLNKGDVLLIGQLNPSQDGPLNAGLSNVIRGDGSVSSGQVVHIASHKWTLVADLKDHVNTQRWDGRLCLIDTHARAGSTLQDAAIGQMATCAMAWAFQGEMFAAATRKGKTLVTYASIGEPYGRDWYSLFLGQKVHTRYHVPPIPPGKIARDYLRTCQAQLAQFFEHKQGPQYRLAAGRMAKVMHAGGTVWAASGSHVLVQGAIIPPDLPRMVILGKSYDWRVAYLKKGDLLFLLGNLRYPKTNVDEALAAGGQVVTMSTTDGPTDDSRTHIQTFWAPWDSSVNVPDYPVRILPITGVEQLVQWYSLLAETQKLVEPAAASPASDLTVYGQPPLGAFGIESVAHVEACSKLGMTLLFTYSTARGKQFLDVNDPMGKAVREHKMQVMFNLSSRFTNVRLAREVAPGDTTIAVLAEKPADIDAFPPSGTLAIEGERITYAAHTREAFTGCQRGAEGTTAARPAAELILCNSEALKQEILAAKDSPNLWGYWMVDDARPFEGDCLKEMARVIRQYDHKADGTPCHHVIVMGICGTRALPNFSKGICDAVGIYLYPYYQGKLNTTVRKALPQILQTVRAEQPDIGVIGVPQAFVCEEQRWSVMPTPDQIREDILTYLAVGAIGQITYMYHSTGPKGEPWGFESSPGACEAIGKAYAEIRAGALKPGGRQ